MAYGKVQEEIRRWELQFEEAARVQGEPREYPNKFSFVMDKLFAELRLQLFKRTSDGTLKRDGSGNPKVDVLGLLMGIFRLAGKIIVLVRLYDAGLLKPAKSDQ